MNSISLALNIGKHKHFTDANRQQTLYGKHHVLSIQKRCIKSFMLLTACSRISSKLHDVAKKSQVIL